MDHFISNFAAQNKSGKTKRTAKGIHQILNLINFGQESVVYYSEQMKQLKKCRDASIKTDQSRSKQNA